MKKILISLVSVVVLLLAAVIIVPGFMDWGKYKSEITTKAREATGRDILVNGDIKLRILPSPSIIVNNIQVNNPDGFQSNKPFATIEKVEVNAALKPLFKKQIHILGVTLVSPTIHMQKIGDTTNWEFKNGSQNSNESATNVSNKNSDLKLSFDEIAISNGQFLYSEGTNQPQRISSINALLKGQDIDGPFELTGALEYNKIPANFNVTTSKIITGKAINVKAVTSVDNKNAVFEFSGNVGGESTNNSGGDVKLTINDPKKLMASIGKTVPSLPAFLSNKIQSSAKLVLSNKGTDLNDLELIIGKLSAKGTASYSSDKKLGVSLSTDKIDLSQKAASAPNPDKQTSSNLTYASSIDKSFQTLSGLVGTAIPSDLTAALELRVKELITQDKAQINDIEVSALVEKSNAKISKISAKLPGQSSISIVADLPLKNQKIEQINSKISFKTQKTTETFSVFGISDLARGFSPLDTKTTLKITKDQLAISDTTLKFGKNSISGLSISYAPAAKTPLSINTKGGDLDFNTLTNDKKPSETSADKTETETNEALGLSPEISQKLNGLKADINIKLDQIISGENLARNITFNSTIDGQRITINEASIGDLGDLNSLNIKVTGVVGKLSPFDDIDLKINASSDDLSRTLWAFGNKNAGDIGKANFSASIKGSQDQVNLNADGKIDQGQIKIEGVVKDLAKNPSLTGQLSAQHPETSIVLKNFANMKTQNNKMGPFAMSTKITASAKKFKTDELVVNMGSQGTIGGFVNYDKTVTPGVIDVELNADLLPLGSLTGAKTNRVGGGEGATAAPKTWSQKPIDLSALRNTSGKIKIDVKKLTYDAFVFDNFALLANVADGTLTLEKLAANMFDGNFSVSGVLNAAPLNQLHKGQFTIDVNNANVESVFNALGSKAFGGGILSLNQSLNFLGSNQLNIIKSLNGNGNIIVENGSFNGLDLDSLAEKIDRPNSPSDFLAIIQQNKAGGTSTFEKLEAPIKIENGVLNTSDLAIKSQKTQIDLDGLVNLPSQNLKLDGSIKFVEQRNLPSLGLTISGPLYAPKKQLKTDNILRFYTQKATQDLGQKALDKLFGKQEPAANDNTAPVNQDAQIPSQSETQNIAPNSSESPEQKPASEPNNTQNQQPQDVEDVLKQQGEQLLRGLLGGQ